MTNDSGQSVVTVKRYKSGKTFEEYLDSGVRNLELFRENYHDTKITESQESSLKAIASKGGGADHMMVVGEDWCPDVYRGAAIAARISEAMGIEYRFFERDQNKDIMAEFLNGDFESIPVFVFYDADHRELGNFKERPEIANEQMGEIRKVLGDMTPEGIAAKLGHEPSEEEIQAARAEARERYMEWQRGPIWAGWRDATVDEVIETLS